MGFNGVGYEHGIEVKNKGIHLCHINVIEPEGVEDNPPQIYLLFNHSQAKILLDRTSGHYET